MNKNIIDVLEECIKAIDLGDSLEDCLKRYPEYANVLSGMLSTTKELSTLRVDTIPREAKDSSRIHLLSKAKALAAANGKNKQITLRDELADKFWAISQALQVYRLALGRLVIALGIAVIFLVLSGGLLITSAKSLPGDSLYPVKLAVEDLQYRLASNVVMRHEYESRYTEQRVEEVKSLLEMGRSQRVSFESVVISIDGSVWNVGGVSVEVRSSTIIVGGIGGTKEIKPGMVIEIEGTTNPNGWVEAAELHIREYQFIGSVDRITASYWLISGIQVNIPGAVRIDKVIKTGDDVIVKVHSEDSGLYAISILRVSSATSTPTSETSSRIVATEEDSDDDEPKEKYTTQGVVNEIKEQYWVVSGEIFFVVSSTEFEREINIGDEVRIDYIIEKNGSFTAVKIERMDVNEELDGEEEETPHPTETEDVKATEEPTETEEHEEEHTPEPTEKPQPSETPEPND